MPTRVDLHLHTRFSRRSSEWLLRQFDFPDSASDPRKLYQQLRDAGMDFVTFTDHNQIEGCLEIADLKNTFISEEVTTYFPEDRTKVHLLVWNITEADHREIGRLRKDIYDLQSWLQQQAIAHAVAHPLFAIQPGFSISHLEKLLLLFQCFEGINGLRNALFNDTFQYLTEHLTKEKIAQLSEKHHLPPKYDKAWKKILIGGSNDHGGVFPGSAWTEIPAKAKSVQDFFRNIQNGYATAKGKGGTPLALSHGMYNTVYFFLKERFLKESGPTTNLIETAFSRFMEGKNPTELTILQKLRIAAEGIRSGRIFEMMKPGNVSLWKELNRYIQKSDLKQTLEQETGSIPEPERRSFVMANIIAHQLAFRFFERCIREFSSGNPIEGFQSISALLPIVTMLSPYLYAFQSQTSKRRWLEEICLSFTGTLPVFLQNNKRVWATDTLDEVNGVSTTIQRMSDAALRAKADIVVITSTSRETRKDIPVHNFKPIGEFALPEYELQKLSFPPVLQIIDFIQSGNYSEVIISTPGPLGLTALLAAKMLGLRTSGIYHTDFPEYVRMLTDDTLLETLTWKYMCWFYSQLDTVYVNSEAYRRSWMERGIPSDKLKILPRGLDLKLYHPKRRDAKFWAKYGLQPHEKTILYVGRISKEKNLEELVAIQKKLSHLPVRFLLVGDGPFKKQLQKAMPTAIFTGVLSGKILAKAYASADLFIFPSTTDTFGNVILEALASGLPCIVSNIGGPNELIEDGVTGAIVAAHNSDAFAKAIATYLSDAEKLIFMQRAARASVENRNWDSAFEQFWNGGE